MISPDDSSEEATLASLEYLLRWYAAMGVDAPVDESPHDRFAAVVDAEPAPAHGFVGSAGGRPAPERTGPNRSELDGEPSRNDLRPRTRPSLDATPKTADALVRQAEALAADAMTAEALIARWETLPGCGLAATASRMIVAGGRFGAPVLVAGGAPEADDERVGEAFAGAHGRLLDAMLRAIGLDRAQVYLINVVPWRPPGNRVPTPLELALCLPFARRLVALAEPRLILCLGERAAQPLLGSREPISRLRGRWMAFEGEAKTVKTLVTFAPGYLLKQPLQKRRTWIDLQMLKAEHALSDGNDSMGRTR